MADELNNGTSTESNETTDAEQTPMLDRSDFMTHENNVNKYLADLDNGEFLKDYVDISNMLVKHSDVLKYEERDALSNWTNVGLIEIGYLLEGCFVTKISEYKEDCKNKAEQLDNEDYQNYLSGIK